MARMKISKHDDFQESVVAFMEFVKKNFAVLILSIAVLVAAIAYVYISSKRSKSSRAKHWKLVAGGADYSSAQLEKFTEELRGTEYEPWLKMRRADALYKEYMAEDAFLGKRGKLEEAGKICEEIIKTYPDNPNLVSSAKLSLDVINRELSSPGVLTERPELKTSGTIQPRDWGMPGIKLSRDIRPRDWGMPVDESGNTPE